MNKQLNQRINIDGAWYIDAAVRLTKDLPTATEDEKWRIEVSIDTLIHLANIRINKTLDEHNK